MLRRSCFLMALLGLAACAETDPYSRAFSWQPTGANANNIAAQVANKNDLIRGRGVSRSDGVESVQPIYRLYEGNPKPLPVTSSKGS